MWSLWKWQSVFVTRDGIKLLASFSTKRYRTRTSWGSDDSLQYYFFPCIFYLAICSITMWRFSVREPDVESILCKLRSELVMRRDGIKHFTFFLYSRDIVLELPEVTPIHLCRTFFRIDQQFVDSDNLKRTSKLTRRYLMTKFSILMKIVDWLVGITFLRKYNENSGNH
jgi:hypothetical protein